MFLFPTLLIIFR